MGDAIIRTLVRLFVTRRHLLEWTTAAQSTESPRLDLRGFYRKMAGGTSLGLVMTASAVAFAPSSWQLVLPFALLRSEEHTSELQSLMRISYAVFCLKKKNSKQHKSYTHQH